jgi:hypothetical protein
MNKKIRYSIIIFGFLIFFTLSPIIVFYVRGLTPNFKEQTYEETGIITVQSDPKNAKILINDEIKDTTPNSLRFIKPGEYNIKLQKDGYFSWEKQLTVKPGKVTWLQNGVNSVTLFLNKPETTQVNSEIIDVLVKDNYIYSLSNKTLILTNISNLNQNEIVLLPETVVSLHKESNNTDFIIIKGTNHWLIFDTANKKITTLSPLVSTNAELFTSNSGSLFSLEKNTLNKISWRSQTIEPIENNISTAAIKDDQIYTISSNAIFVRNISSPENSKTPILVSKELPKITSPKLFITSQKEIFLLTDKTLYKIGQKPELISENVQKVIEDHSDQTIITITQNEILFYNWENGQNQLITRFSQIPSDSQIDLQTGYAFIAKNGTIEAIELDNRDHQNTYNLYSGENIKFLWLDNQAKKIILQDNLNIQLLKIR